MKKAVPIIAMAAVLAVGGIVWWRGGGTRTVPDPPPFTPSEQQDQQIVEVIQTARAAAVAEPGNGAKRAALAMVLHGNDLLELAEQTYVQALALDPDQARWWYQLAKVQAARGALDEAMASLDRAESLEPAYAPIHWRRGYWLLDLGRLEEASAAFNRALSISPTEPAARVGLARSKLLAGRNEEAIAVLEPIVQDLPQVGYLHQLLASAYARSGRFPEAAAQSSLADGVPPNWRDSWSDEVSQYRTGYLASFQQADQLSAAGRIDDAIALLQRLRESHPEDSMACAKLGEAYLENQDLDRAQRMLEQAIRLDERNYAALLHLANVYRQKNDTSRALTYIDRSLEVNPSFGPAYRLKADLLVPRREWAEVEQALAAAIRYGGGSLQTHVDLATVQYQLGRRDEATATLQRVLSQDPANVRALLVLAQIRGELGDFQNAESLLARAQRIRPNDPAVRSTAQRIRQLQEGTVEQP